MSSYSHALRYTSAEDEIRIVKRNRSLPYLKTKQFDAALADLEYPEFGPEPSEKTLLRATEALYALEKFDACHNTLVTLLTAFPNNTQATKLMGRVRQRLQEQRIGNYDFAYLFKRVSDMKPTIQDVATFVGPIEVRQTGAKGRGIFTTKAVKAGDLLLCEKAYCYSFGRADGKDLTILYQYDIDRVSMGKHANLIKCIVQKLYRNPSTASNVLKLYHGAYEKVDVRTVDEQPVVDS